ncbi:MAG: NADH-quinone oxidoreductase subunit, partial [Bacteroidota bacterium]|nr:NADH-quinone oxidoreductase subunit [Bacteroidota bacterium]
MPHIIIDGERIETKAGKTVIEAAYENGLQIPHFCWHPELSVSGNCRMCLVEIGMPKRMQDGAFDTGTDGKPVVNYFPKLQIACATTVTDGMHVLTHSDKAIKAREAVMEFLLINHPLDCPICDEAGQCKLQEYSYIHSKGESRFTEEKTHGDKRIPWSDKVLYDAERCIKCSRCIRFGQEIAGQDVLTFINRGDHVTIKVAEGTRFDNDYSMNVIDICPVGALTSPDFRFKSRVWDMSFNPSICPGCSRGCNIKIGVRNNEILRLEPDVNMQVNKYWMCDEGRLKQFPFVNKNRINEPLVRIDNTLRECSWDEAHDYAIAELRRFKAHEIMFVASERAACEGNYLLNKFARKVLKCQNVDFPRHIDETFEDRLLRRKEIAPNATGAEAIGCSAGIHAVKMSELAEKIHYQHIKAIYILEEDFTGYESLL